MIWKSEHTKSNKAAKKAALLDFHKIQPVIPAPQQFFNLRVVGVKDKTLEGFVLFLIVQPFCRAVLILPHSGGGFDVRRDGA